MLEDNLKSLGLESRGQCTTKGYRVQVRVDHFVPSAPVTLADGLVGTEWRDVTFQKTDWPGGIPDHPWSHRGEHGLLSLEGARALAWTLLAQQDRHGLECQLVQLELHTTYTVKREGVVQGERMTVSRNPILVSKAAPTP